MNGSTLLMARLGFAALIFTATVIVVAAIDIATPGDMSVGMALGIAGICIGLGAVAQFFIFQKLRVDNGR